MRQDRPLDSRQLYHFVCVVDSGSFSRAAQNLNISQPALTQSIKNLETTLNASILNRNTRGNELTEIGEHLYKYAKRILNESHDAVREIELLRQGSMGHVNIASSSIFTDSIIAPVIKSLNKHYPKLSLSITVGMFNDLLPGLEAGEFDFVFTNFPSISMSSNFHLEALCKTQTVFLIGSTHPLAGKDEVDKIDMSRFRFATVKISRTSDYLAQIYGDLGINAVDAIESNSINLLKSLVVAGEVVSLMPVHLVADEIRSGTIKTLKVKGMPIERDGGIVSLSNSPQRLQIELVKDEIRKTCTAQESFFVNAALN